MLLLHTLSRLTFSDQEWKPLLAGFLLHYAAVIGFKPRLVHCVGCGRHLTEGEQVYFDLAEGGLCCEACHGKGTVPLAAEQARWMRQSLLGGLTESLVVFVPAGLILSLDAWTIAALVLARWSFTLVYNADTVAEMRLFGGVSSKFLTMLFYLLLMLLIALPGAAAALALFALGHCDALCYAALALLNAPMSLLVLFLCRNMLQCAELNDA